MLYFQCPSTNRVAGKPVSLAATAIFLWPRQANFVSLRKCHQTQPAGDRFSSYTTGVYSKCGNAPS